MMFKNLTLRETELLFADYRESKNVKKLIELLRLENPKSVKTFKLVDTGHKFHSLYGFIPHVSKKTEKKQIKLNEESMLKLLHSTTTSSQAYLTLREKMTDDNLCPCELISNAFLQINDNHQMNKTKNFNYPPKKTNIKSETLKIFNSYSIDAKIKKRINKTKKQSCLKTAKQNKKIDWNNLLVDCISTVAGDSLINNMCRHIGENEITEIQTKSGDEMVTLLDTCKICFQKFVV